MDTLTKAFLDWANGKGYDTAHAYNENKGRWMFLHPMTADVYEAWQAAQSVAVVGEPVAWVNINKNSDVTRTVKRRDSWCKTPLYALPTHSIPAAELATLREKAAEADELRKDAERYRWLRDPSVYVGKVIDKVAGYEPMTELGTGGYPIYEYRAGSELDEAIDAAIAQDKGE